MYNTKRKSEHPFGSITNGMSTEISLLRPHRRSRSSFFYNVDEIVMTIYDAEKSSSLIDEG